MNLQDLEISFNKLKSVFDRYQSVKQELLVLQQELSKFMIPSGGWKNTNTEVPLTGQKVLTAEIDSVTNKEVYNVLLFSTKDKLYKYWCPLDSLPNS